MKYGSHIVTEGDTISIDLRVTLKARQLLNKLLTLFAVRIGKISNNAEQQCKKQNRKNRCANPVV